VYLDIIDAYEYFEWDSPPGVSGVRSAGGVGVRTIDRPGRRVPEGAGFSGRGMKGLPAGSRGESQQPPCRLREENEHEES